MVPSSSNMIIYLMMRLTTSLLILVGLNLCSSDVLETSGEDYIALRHLTFQDQRDDTFWKNKSLMEQSSYVDWIQEDTKSTILSLNENFTSLLRDENTVNWWNEFCAMSFVHQRSGEDESFDENNNTSHCINIAILLGGEEDFNQMKDIANFTITLLNDRTIKPEWDFLTENTTINYRIEDSKCNETSSFDAYWKIREEWKGDIQAVIGPACSADALGIGWLTTVEHKVQVLHIASSRRLSDKKEFPFVSRLVAPDSSRGEVGAMGEMLQGFGWDRVSILSTDSLYANDYVNEFKKLNKSFTIPLTEVITYDENGLDETSIRSSLNRINNLDWAMRSKVVLLVADISEVKRIFTIAKEAQLSSDTIWVGSSKWCRFEFWKDFNFNLPENPGYFGIIPFTNRVEILEYVNKLQDWLGKEDNTTEVPNYSAEYLVDSILAVTLAFDATPYDEWSNASLVTNTMRNLSFEGLSGNVSFTKEGDRENPMYSIINLQRKNDGTLYWEVIGDVKTTENSTNFDVSKNICFPGEFGCNNELRFPSEMYDLPINQNLYFLSFILLLILLMVFMIWRNDKKQKSLQVEMTNLQERKKEIDEKLYELDTNLEKEMTQRIELMRSRGEFVLKPATWTNSKDILVEVLPSEQQYWDVTKQLQESMKNAFISKLWRIQNKSLWDYYSFHKDRFAKNNIPPNEKNVWHGTSTLDPAIIYCDPQDGFMIQYSSKNSLWGQGIYFAAKSEYSHKYSFHPSSGNMQSCQERPNFQEDEHEIFLTKLLVGNEIRMHRTTQKDICRALRVPPTDPQSGLKYNTVTGKTRNCQVWVVYENGRAYPDYLVRYYVDQRDPIRTPFECQEDVYHPSPSLSHYHDEEDDETEQQQQQREQPMDIEACHGVKALRYSTRYDSSQSSSHDHDDEEDETEQQSNSSQSSDSSEYSQFRIN